MREATAEEVRHMREILGRYSQLDLEATRRKALAGGYSGPDCAICSAVRKVVLGDA